MTIQVRDALPPVTDITTPNLTTEESVELLECINKVRAGELEFSVLLTNKKVSPSPRRKPGPDYLPHPALRSHAHKGWMVSANTNKKGEVYLHILDEARRTADNPYGHTRITMKGILSFEVLGQRPGPLAAEFRPQLLQGDQQPAQPPFDPTQILAQAHALALQAQALSVQAQMLAQLAGQAVPQQLQHAPPPPLD
jgi:hypothetical protein